MPVDLETAAILGSPFPVLQRTEDYGATFTALDSPGETVGQYHELRLHPHKADWVLAKVRRNECLKLLSISKWCAHDLYVSQVRAPP